MLSNLFRGQSCAFATMGMKQIGLPEATNILLDRLFAKANPMIYIIANGFWQSPHISAEDFHALNLLSLFVPRCGKVELVVSGNA